MIGPGFLSMVKELPKETVATWQLEKFKTCDDMYFLQRRSQHEDFRTVILSIKDLERLMESL